MEIVVLANRYKVHHFRNLEERFTGRFVYEESVAPAAILAHDPELVICFDEHYCELANTIGTLKRAGVATLQVMDGILEWRRTWDYRREGHRVDGVVLPLNQPVVSHKIACLGRRDARIMESWGNFGKCEIVGAPRMDALLAKRLNGTIPVRLPPGRKHRLLVMTAKTPGFTPEQVRTTTDAMRDLKECLDGCPDIETVWRLTSDLDRELRIRNVLTDLAGAELAHLLEEVDAVITTPSTSLLEAMLLERPVALLDYFNTPHYFETAWTISSRNHILPVVGELLDPPRPKFDFQRFLLDEQLASRSLAAGRLATLMEEMVKIRRLRKGGDLEFPTRILRDQDLFVSTELPLTHLKDYYPLFPIPEEMDVKEMRIELAAARGTIASLYEKVEFLSRRLSAVPGYGLLRRIRKALRGKRW